MKRETEPKLATNLLGWGMPLLGVAFLCLSCWFLASARASTPVYPKVVYTTTGAVVHQGTAGDPIEWTGTGAWGYADYSIASIAAGSATLYTATDVGTELSTGTGHKVFVNSQDANAGLYSVASASGTLITMTTTFTATYTGTAGTVYRTPTNLSTLTGYEANLNGMQVSLTGTGAGLTVSADTVVQSTGTVGDVLQVNCTTAPVTLTASCYSTATGNARGLIKQTGTFPFTMGDFYVTNGFNTTGAFTIVGTGTGDSHNITVGNIVADVASSSTIFKMYGATGVGALTLAHGSLTVTSTGPSLIVLGGTSTALNITSTAASTATLTGTAWVRYMSLSGWPTVANIATGPITISGTGSAAGQWFFLTAPVSGTIRTSGSVTISHTGGMGLFAVTGTASFTYSCSGGFTGPASISYTGAATVGIGANTANFQANINIAGPVSIPTAVIEDENAAYYGVYTNGTFNGSTLSVTGNTGTVGALYGIRAASVTMSGTSTVAGTGAVGIVASTFTLADLTVSGASTGISGTGTGAKTMSTLTVSAAGTGVSLASAGSTFTASNMIITAGTGITSGTFTGNTISVATITMTGTGATAITSTATGNTIRGSTITISGDNNTGINAPGNTITSASISITSTGSQGIIADGGTAYFGDVRVSGAGSTGVSNLNGTNVGGVIMTTTAGAIGVNYTGTSAGSLRAYGIRATAGRPTVTGTLGVEATTIDGPPTNTMMIGQ